MRSKMTLLVAIAVLMTAAGEVRVHANAPRDAYNSALARERELRSSEPTLRQLRAGIEAYLRIVRRFPTSGYSDNALWQAAGLALEAYTRFGEERDRRTGERSLSLLRTEYPASSLQAQVSERLALFEAAGARTAANTPPSPAPAAVVTASNRAATSPPTRPSTGPVMVRQIERRQVGDLVRVTIEMDAEVAYYEERLAAPDRVFFDLKGTTTAPDLTDATLRYDAGFVREIRLGRHPNATTRVVVDLEGIARYSVFSLYNPYRLVIDCLPAGPLPSSRVTTAAAATLAPVEPAVLPAASADTELEVTEIVDEKPTLISTSSGFPSAVPSPPSRNSSGTYSLSRQLGLGISRIVIDPGHGGHDPGAKGQKLTESELVLDVALRLERLLLKEGGVEVVLTRRSDTYVPLEERTAIANREGADLFLSIHANASRNTSARGVETYFLNFASNREAEEVAARENAASGMTMSRLNDIVQAIALNNKLDESRDFAELVQTSMVRRLKVEYRDVRDLGVKQAPFVVLVGASMPSVLAEISFVTNRTEAQLLRTAAYRQRIAEALLDALMQYRHSLKNITTVARQ